jgi:hypothetical protein
MNFLYRHGILGHLIKFISSTNMRFNLSYHTLLACLVPYQLRSTSTLNGMLFSHNSAGNHANSLFSCSPSKNAADTSTDPANQL